MKKALLLIFVIAFFNHGLSYAQGDCPPPVANSMLDINNVAAHFSNSGLEWNNPSQIHPGYEIPKGSGMHSIFTGGMWLAGLDESQNLRTNVRQYMSYDHEGSFRPGPMNNLSAGDYVTADCSEFDHIYKINRSEVELHRLYFEMMEANGGVPPITFPFENGYEIPENILNWPAHAEVLPGEPQKLAPYFDNDCCGGIEGVYEPELGDYPAFRFPDNEDDFDCEKHLLGDQVLWWVVNDAFGEVEGVNDGFLIFGIEVQNMAYAFMADDHLNNTTFLRRNVINRSGWKYTDVYFGQFIDGDLGNPNDDYVGTDVDRGMAYFYNGDNYDENTQSVLGYGASPPAIGFNWVGGPLADENDGIDNNFNKIIDEPGERLRMSGAMYYNKLGSPPATQGPVLAIHYYNYLQGIWRDGTPLSYGGSGYAPGDTDPIPCMMVYPDDTDPLQINTHGVEVAPWTEGNAANPPGDRRIIMSSGPFTFNDGEEKVFTLAIPWALEENCAPFPCTVELLKEANDLAQELHDNCYEMPCMVLDAQFDVTTDGDQAFFSSLITSGEEYHWTFGDGSEMTTTSPFASHTYASSGEILACLEIDFGCGTSSYCDTLSVIISSVQEVSINPQIELYPNPAKDQLHIQLSGFDQIPHSVQVYALSGQLVKSENLTSNTQNTIDISALPNGLYILKAGDANGDFIIHERFVVVR